MTRQQPVSIGIHGASGRMGREIAQLIAGEYASECRTAAAVSSGDSLDPLADTHVIVDFSLPDGTARLVDWMLQRKATVPALISGTTGLSDGTQIALDKLGRSTRVLHANNFSAGAAALACIVEFAAPMLERLGYTAVLTETHHRHKKDAPSGTALTLVEKLESAFTVRPAVHSIREGEVIGKHDVAFHGADDEILIRHDAGDRRLFARGAVEAALWLCAQPDGAEVYTMESYFRQRFL